MSDDGATPKVTQEELDEAWRYATEYYKDPKLRDTLGVLAKYRPEVFYGYMKLRQGAFNMGPDAALSTKIKELVIIAIEVATRKTNPPPIGHTRRAIEAGATVEEIAEVVSLCLLISGMLTYHESGMHVLKAAEEFAAAKAARP